MIYACITVAFVAIVTSFTVLRLRTDTKRVRELVASTDTDFDALAARIDTIEATANEAMGAARDASNASAIRGR